MDPLATIRRRHASQRLAGEPLGSPAEVVRWFGAVQAQEYGEAKWSLAQRCAGEPTEVEVEDAFAAGEILRTHVLRPTWHFVAPEDIRWMLRLSAPRLHQAARYGRRQTELDEGTLARCHRVIERELADGEPRTRRELIAALRADGIDGDSQRFIHVFMHAEVEGLVCSGPPRGKQHTYALLDDRVPPGDGPEGEAALAELARRYFRSHAPATARDFSWWSGLTLRIAREAIALCEPALERADDEDGTPWFWPPELAAEPAPAAALLLSTFDELIVAYKDLRIDRVGERTLDGVLTRTAALGARTVGGWSRELSRQTVTVRLTPLSSLAPGDRAALDAEVARFGRFLGLDARLEVERAA